MSNIEQALKNAIETIENADKLLATLGIIVDSRWSAESLNQCKSALAEIDKGEPVATAEANKRIAELQASNNYLREALVICKQFITEAILDDNYHEASCGLDEIYNLRDKAIKLSEAAISATPAESLQAHEIRGDNPDSKNRELVYAEAIHKYHKWVTT